MYMNTISRSFEKVVAPLVLAAGLNACGSAPQTTEKPAQQTAVPVYTAASIGHQVQSCVDGFRTQYPKCGSEIKVVDGQEENDYAASSCVNSTFDNFTECLETAARNASNIGACEPINTARNACSTASESRGGVCNVIVDEKLDKCKQPWRFEQSGN